MIEVSAKGPKPTQHTKILRCPHCSTGRICDVPASLPGEHKITKHDNFDVDLLIKCPHCGDVIGIKIK
jgi:hypothetical protein